jgi:dihydrofolate reductase
MTAMYTLDVFTSLDGFGAHQGDWGGYWGKQGPEYLAYRDALLAPDQRMVYGATTFRENVELFAMVDAQNIPVDPWVERMRNLPATVISSTLTGPLDWRDATVAKGDAVDIVTRLKQESDVPLRSQASLKLNRDLAAAGLIDRIELTIFPVITGKTGLRPVFKDWEDFDLELLDSHTFDGRTTVLAYRPTLHRTN